MKNQLSGLPALSIRQPWATSILHGKGIENRNWRTNFRGRFLIHAAKEMTDDDAQSWRVFVDRWIPPECMTWAKDMKLGHLPRGGIIGVATLVDCVTAHTSPWFTGQYGFVLSDVQPLPFVPCRGIPGFFYPKVEMSQPGGQIISGKKLVANAAGSVPSFDIKKRERFEKMKAAWNAQEQRRQAIKKAKRDGNKLAHITPQAYASLEGFYLTCPLAKKEVVSLAIMELVERKPTNSELLKLWEKHRAQPSPASTQRD